MYRGFTICKKQFYVYVYVYVSLHMVRGSIMYNVGLPLESLVGLDIKSAVRLIGLDIGCPYLCKEPSG